MPPARLCCGATRVACVYWRIAADTAASTETVDPTRWDNTPQVIQRRIGWKARPLLRILYGSEDCAVVAGVPPARLAVAARVSRAGTAELQPTRLPLQSNK